MTGYQDLLDAYANNHQALVIVRESIRDSVNSVRQVLLMRLGLPQSSEVVLIEGEDGQDLFLKMSFLEHKDTLRARVVINLNGANYAPDNKVSIPICFRVDDGYVVVSLPSIGGSYVMRKPEQYTDIGNEIYVWALNRLTDYQ